jgi:hypothetical protein
MGHIAYFDARARKQVADSAPFDAQVRTAMGGAAIKLNFRRPSLYFVWILT